MKSSVALKNIYTNPKHPGSFGGANRLYNYTKSYSNKEINQYLSGEDSYTKQKQRYTKFIRRKVNCHEKNYIWQADLIFMRKYSKFNSNYKYILTVIDVFSKLAFAIPLKNKTTKSVIEGFKIIFESYNSKPKYLQCDLGSEFFSSLCKNFLKENNIILYNNFSEFKACVVERFNRTLLTRLSKYFSHTNKLNYINVLQDIMYSYNRTKHRSINMRPIDVNKYNEMDVWIYTNRELFKRKLSKPQFKVGNQVRILLTKKLFQKGYDQSYSSELFFIEEILNTHPITYKLKDSLNNTINGAFYENEINIVLIN